MFGIILISGSTLLHLYVFWRAASVPIVARHVSRKLLFGAGVCLWTIFFSARVFGHGGTGPLAAAVELAGMTWMGVLFLTSVCLLAVDLITLFGFLAPRRAPSFRGWALIAAGALSLIALFQGLRPPVVQHHEVAIKGLRNDLEGMVIVAMSDLHLGSQRGERWLASRIAEVNAERPDLVVLLGDILEGHGPPQGDLLSTFGHLSAPLGVWAVPGNHEFHEDQGASISLMEQTGLNVLRDRWAQVRPDLVLAGVDDLTALRRAGERRDSLSKALAGRPPGATILLSHTPWEAEKAASAGVGLMLCGQTHGGQIWPFGYIIRMIYPLLGGSYEVNGMTVIVCRGTGTWGPRMRLWRPSEILRVVLDGREKT